jgi:hypothetical protein
MARSIVTSLVVTRKEVGARTVAGVGSTNPGRGNVRRHESNRDKKLYQTHLSE